jgi:hypothetical protein
MTLMVSAGRGKGVMIFAATGGFARSPRFHRPRASGYADILSLPRIGGRLSLPPLETLMRLPRCPRPAAIVGPVLLAGLAAALALAPLQPAPAQPKPAPGLPTDLALVHPDALGFVHVRVAELWHNDALKQARELLRKAGPRALAALDEQFVPKPSTVDRVTAVILPPGNGRSDPQVTAILRFTEAFDPAAVRKSYLKDGVAKKAGDKEYYVDRAQLFSLYIPDDRTLVLADDKTLGDYLTWAPKDEGGLTDALKLAATKPILGAVNLARLPLPPGFEEFVPPEYKPLLKARLLTVGMDFGKEVTLNARLLFRNAADATEGEKSVYRAAEIARKSLVRPRQQAEKQLYGTKPHKGPRPIDALPEAIGAVTMLAGLNAADEFLTHLPVKRDGAALTASLTLPSWATPYLGMSAVSVGLLLPAVQKVREAAARATSQNNLRQIAIAMHSYHDVNGALPPAAIVGKRGKKLLSWRVMILPYIEQAPLYQQFKLDEPWDSEHNKKLIARMPKTYVDPRMPAEPGKTYYKVFVGKDAGFEWVRARKFPGGFPDGTSNTIMVIAGGGDPVIWTKPDDIEFDMDKPLPDLRKPFRNILAAMFDGSVRLITPAVPEKTLKLLINPHDGMPIPNY